MSQLLLILLQNLTECCQLLKSVCYVAAQLHIVLEDDFSWEKDDRLFFDFVENCAFSCARLCEKNNKKWMVNFDIRISTP